MTEYTPDRSEAQVERSRASLGGLLAELDRRRHQLTDMRRQLRQHPVAIIGTLTATLGLIAAVTYRGLSTRAERRTFSGRAGRLRQALGRAIEHPERVARSEPSAGKKILVAAATSAVSVIARRLAQKYIQAPRPVP
jgi:hypothetical protein